MKQTVFVSAVAIFLTASLMSGHHSYGDYDRNASVTLEGTLKRVLWANPHVVMTLETKTKGEYLVEWASVLQLNRQGINSVPLKEGDQVIVTGSVNRNPEKRILTILREISRPADGWHWATPPPTTP